MLLLPRIAQVGFAVRVVAKGELSWIGLQIPTKQKAECTSGYNPLPTLLNRGEILRMGEFILIQKRL